METHANATRAAPRLKIISYQLLNTRDEKYTLPTRKSMKSGRFPGFPEPSAFPSFYKNSDLV